MMPRTYEYKDYTFSYKSNWLRSNTFKEVSGVDMNTISQIKHHREPKWIKKDGRFLYVDFGFLSAGERLRNDMWNLAHKVYEVVIYDLKKRPCEIAPLLLEITKRSKGSWEQFLSTDIFHRVDDLTLTNTWVGARVSDFLGWFSKSDFIKRVEENFTEDEMLLIKQCGELMNKKLEGTKCLKQ